MFPAHFRQYVNDMPTPSSQVEFTLHTDKDCTCPIQRSDARTHVRKLRVLQSKCLRIATNAPWYVSNKQIHDDLGRHWSTNSGFQLKVGWCGEPPSLATWRHLCRPLADQSRLKPWPRATGNQQASRPIRRRPSWQKELCPALFSDTGGFRDFPQLLRQMPRNN